MSDTSICFYSKCPFRGILRATGDDALNYLQGQFSNQLEQPGEHPVVYGFWLSIKGKVDADSYVLKQAENDYLVISFGSDEGTLLQKLEKNIIADDVVLEGVTDQYQAWITWGSSLRPIEALLNCALPASLEGGGFKNGWVFRSKLLRSNNCVWLLPVDEVISFDSVAVHRPFDIARMGEAVPLIPQDIGPGEFPQEGGLADVGVSVKKGCYLGQEIMMRIHSMGEVKRSLYTVSLSVDIPPLPVDLFLGERSVGTLRSIVCFNGAQQGLALLKKSLVKPGFHLSLSPGGDACVEVLNSVQPIV